MQHVNGIQYIYPWFIHYFRYHAMLIPILGFTSLLYLKLSLKIFNSDCVVEIVDEIFENWQLFVLNLYCPGVPALLIYVVYPNI